MDKGDAEFLKNGCGALQCPTCHLSIFFLGETRPLSLVESVPKLMVHMVFAMADFLAGSY